ncbi:MAG: sensor histidine kinase [Spirochaetota bacterium]
MSETARAKHVLLIGGGGSRGGGSGIAGRSEVGGASEVLLSQQRTLESHGYRVTVVRERGAAIECVRDDPSIDLVMVDIGLDGGTGGAGTAGAGTAGEILNVRRLPVVLLSLDDAAQGLVKHVEGLIHSRYAPERADEGEPQKSELQASEAQSEQRRRYLEAVLRATPNAVVTLDAAHRVLDWNPGAEEIFGYSGQEARGQEIDELIAGRGGDQQIAAEARDMTSRVAAREVFPHFETVRYRKDGSPVDVVVSGAPILSDGKLVGVVAVYTDISERAKAQRELAEQRERAETLLREREVLFRETQHRTKNDLSLVRSLLSLEASRSEDPACSEVLEEASGRVAVMSRLHELLFRSGDVTDVNVQPFFDEIVEELRSSWAPGEVSMEVCAEDFRVPARLSVSLGIIFNELVTNSLKYGFATGRTGQIASEVGLDENGNVVIYYSDTGVGFPSEVLTGERAGLGLTIIESLVEQHEGKLDLWNDGGARVRVMLKLPPG